MDKYTLRQIKVAFSRYLRCGGNLTFKDTLTDIEGNVIINWEGFLEELEKAKKK